MGRAHWLGLMVVFSLLVIAGCTDGGTDKQKGSADKQYDIKGKVVAVSSDKKEVTLDHEAIPELNMMAMKMAYPVEEAKILESIQPGDRIEGRLKVIAGKNTLVMLKKL